MTNPASKNHKGGRRPGMTEQQRQEETETMLRMRRAGASYQSIADHFDLSYKTVYTRIKAMLEDLPKEEATFLRSMEVQKLDYAESRLQTAVKEGSVSAIRALVVISESRRKLLGLDQPEQHEVKVSREAEDLAEQLANALAEGHRMGAEQASEAGAS